MRKTSVFRTNQYYDTCQSGTAWWSDRKLVTPYLWEAGLITDHGTLYVNKTRKSCYAGYLA